MSEGAREDRAGGAEEERQVAAYLIAHPDFLIRHPEVLAIIDVPHRVPGAVSLIEYQVQRLRRQLAAERKRLAHLIARAREYEVLANRLHNLVLKLIAVERPDQLCHLLRDSLLREFQAEALALKLFAHQSIALASTNPLTQSFIEFIDRRHALCGPLSPERARMLFGTAGGAIQSAAIVPLYTETQAGVIAIGSTDPTRFTDDMQVDILDRLGELISQKLKVVPLEHCEQPLGAAP